MRAELNHILREQFGSWRSRSLLLNYDRLQNAANSRISLLRVANESCQKICRFAAGND